ncbi:MAG: hypothetical protein ABIW82_11095 [Dokdonella sp.]
MNKGEFVTGMLVQPLGSSQVMSLGGTPDAWVCTWTANGQEMSKSFKPEELVSAGTQRDQKR